MTAATEIIPLRYCTIARAAQLGLAAETCARLARACGGELPDGFFTVLVLEHPAVVARLRAQQPRLCLLAPDQIGQNGRIGNATWLHLMFAHDEHELPALLKPALRQRLGERVICIELPEPSPEAVAQHPYSFQSFRDGSPILPAHRTAFRLLAEPNRAQIANPFLESALLNELSRSPQVHAQGYAQALSRIAELEGKLHSFPYSLIGHTGWAMDRLLPGGKERLLDAAHAAERRYGGRLLEKLGRVRRLLAG